MPLHLKTKTLRQISGGWIDFQSPNPRAAEYWNETVRAFSAADWEEKIAEMAALGMDTVVVGATVLEGKAFYPSTIIPERWATACEDPLQAVLSAADRNAIEVFVGVAPSPDGTAQNVPEELHERYGAHASFHGWFLVLEGNIEGTFSDAYIAAANNLAEQCRASKPSRPVLISPTGAETVENEAAVASQLQELKVDYIAYRDGVGARRNEPSELGEVFGRLARIHEDSEHALWAALDLFAFEGPTDASAMIPASFTRLKTQIESVSPHAGKVLGWQYLGLMNPGSSNAFAGHSTSAELHHDYYAWQREQGGH